MATIDYCEDAAEPRDGAETNSAAARPTRVLHVINGEHFAGAERVQDLLAGALPRFGFEVVFAALKGDQFARRRRHVAAPLYDVPMRGRFDLRPARVLADLAIRENCALVHTHTVRAALVGRLAAARAGLPMVHHLHSPTAADSTRRLANLFNTVVERFGTFRIAAAIAVSNTLAEYGVRHGIPRRRIAVVHNGVPIVDELSDRSPPRGRATLGMTALFRPRKGLETLLEAVALLRRQGHDVGLRAVGGFETVDYQRRILEWVDHLELRDAVEWRGFRSDVAAEFAAMDLFILPSLFGEGLPMVLLEAMSLGVPVIATRVEGVPEALRADVDGLIVPPGDASALADAVRRHLTGDVDTQALRASAYARQIECFSYVSMAEGTARTYRRVLSGANARTAQRATF